MTGIRIASILKQTISNINLITSRPMYIPKISYYKYELLYLNDFKSKFDLNMKIINELNMKYCLYPSTTQTIEQILVTSVNNNFTDPIIESSISNFIQREIEYEFERKMLKIDFNKSEQQLVFNQIDTIKEDLFMNNNKIFTESQIKKYYGSTDDFKINSLKFNVRNLNIYKEHISSCSLYMSNSIK
jgi:hypothetical protein